MSAVDARGSASVPMVVMKWRTWALVVLAACIAAALGYWLWPENSGTELTAKSVMRDFYDPDAVPRAEDMLMDPLILNRDLVAPAVIEAVKDPSMKLRRYAIGFLGNERVAEAVPVLQGIVADTSEEEYFRSDALESIYLIDSQRGLALAQQYVQDPTMLGHAARKIVEGRYVECRRTCEQALQGYHE